ncbi:hypothetical protein K1W54_18645 [Micromonospora sp. CPCC 205371]|nr:hypothetical protein [Micromonospora sp. CPCC 205371]
MVDRLGVIVAERQTGEGPQHTRTRFPDWWIPLFLFALFSGAIVYRLLTQ